MDYLAPSTCPLINFGWSGSLLFGHGSGAQHPLPCCIWLSHPLQCGALATTSLTCHRNCAISRMLFLFSSSHNTEACAGRKQRPYKGDQSCAWSLQTPVPSPVPSRPCRDTPRLQVDLELQTTLVSVLQERGRQGVQQPQ